MAAAYEKALVGRKIATGGDRKVYAYGNDRVAKISSISFLTGSGWRLKLVHDYGICMRYLPQFIVHTIDATLTDRLLPPSGNFILGTDQQGRDIFSRIVFGARTTLYIICLVAITAAPIGLIIGTAAGYLGGWVEIALMRLTDTFLAFPKLILALAFAAALGAGMENAVLAIALTSWPPYARIARAETLTVRNSDYLAAARMSGAGPMRILFGHIMPMCIPSLIVRVSLDMAGVILIAAGLGFLGLGVAPPQPEWGAMVSEGREQILEQWWVCTYPGIAICIVSLGFNLIGDSLRDVLDPRGK